MIEQLHPGVHHDSMLRHLNPSEIWFVTSSQNLHGEEVLKQVAANARKIVAALNASGRLPIKLVCQPVLTSPIHLVSLCSLVAARRITRTALLRLVCEANVVATAA